MAYYSSDKYQVRVHRVRATKTEWALDRNGKAFQVQIRNNRSYRAVVFFGAEARDFLRSLKVAEADRDALCAAKFG